MADDKVLEFNEVLTENLEKAHAKKQKAIEKNEANREQKTIIVVSEDGMFTNIPCPIDMMVNIFMAALTGAINQIDGQLKQAKYSGDITEKDYEVARKELFDALNGAYSRQLEIAFPDFELHPELTEEAIKQVMAKEDVMVQHRAKAKKKKEDK